MELADLPGHPARAMARRHKAAIEARLAEKLRENSVGPDRSANHLGASAAAMA